MKKAKALFTCVIVACLAFGLMACGGKAPSGTSEPSSGATSQPQSSSSSISQPAQSSSTEPAIADTKTFKDFENGLADLGLTYSERVVMAAELVGGESGYKYKMENYNIEIYQFDPNSEAYQKAETDGNITLEGFGDFPVYAHGGFVMLEGDLPQEVVDLFNSL